MSAEILPEADCRRSPLKFLGLAVLLILTDVICISGDSACTCGETEFVEHPCDVLRGDSRRSAVCGSCEEHCGSGASCFGPGKSGCRSCGLRTVNGVKVKTFLKLDKPAKRERCAELPGSDDDCNLDRSARGECQACRTCEENQYQAAPCTSEKDTECVAKKKLPPPKFMDYDEDDSHASSRRIGIVLDVEAFEGSSLDEMFLAYDSRALSHDEEDERLLPHGCRIDERYMQGNRSAFVTATESTEIAAIACPKASGGQWLPSDIGTIRILVPPLCECGKDEYVKQKCDRQTGRHVVCGSCTANCGAGGSCSGPRKGECTTCGDMISDAESSDEATARKMFMSIADTSDTVQGICEPCRLSCPKGSYMAKPCAADKNAECKTCSRCQGRSSIFMDCDAQRGFDTICVTGDPVDMPFLEPRVPILLQKASDEAQLQLTSPVGSYMVYSTSHDAETWLRAACFRRAQQANANGALFSTEKGNAGMAPNNASLKFASGSYSLFAVSCPYADGELTGRPPSYVMTFHVDVVEPYRQSKHGDEAVVQGTVHLSGGTADVKDVNWVVWHFQSLLEHAIAQSFESERLTLAVNWYLESDEHEQSAHSDPSAASGSASPTGGFGIGIAYAIFVNAMHAQAVADVTTAQFESTGRVSLALGAAKFGVIDYLSPEVVCSEAQSVSCGYGSTEYEKCTLSEAADGSVECTKLGTLTITRQPGICGAPCSPTRVVSACPACSCHADGCQPSDDAMAVKESFQESAFSSVEDNTTVDIRPSSASSFEERPQQQPQPNASWVWGLAWGCSVLAISTLVLVVIRRAKKSLPTTKDAKSDGSSVHERVTPTGRLFKLGNPFPDEIVIGKDGQDGMFRNFNPTFDCEDRVAGSVWSPKWATDLSNASPQTTGEGGQMPDRSPRNINRLDGAPPAGMVSRNDGGESTEEKYDNQEMKKLDYAGGRRFCKCTSKRVICSLHRRKFTKAEETNTT